MYDKIKRLKDFDFRDKRVLMRVDFNVPLDKKTGEITSIKRIEAALPSIKQILDQNPKQVVIMSHLGKPKKLAEKGEDFKQKLSLGIVAQKLSELLNKPVALAPNYIETPIPTEKIVLLENTRFYFDQEESKDDNAREVLAKKLAELGDIFINDAFGSCHRKHASVYDVAKFLPSGIGLLIEKEIKALSKLIEGIEHPYVAILGGAKVEDKIKIIEALSQKVDHIFIIGAMEFAFEKAMGKSVGDSLCQGVETAKKVLDSSYKGKVLLSDDIVIAKKNNDKYEDIKTVLPGEVPDNYIGLDIGKKTVESIKAKCREAKMILWNGPAGMFEVEEFAKGTNEIAKFLAELDNTRIIGGGDSVSAIEKLKLENKFTHISTGGGASLEFIENEGLPALDILEEKSE